MKPNTTVWRLTAAATAVSMTLGTAPVLAAPPPIGVQSSVSPPERVGRLAALSGSVSFHTADQTVWSPAVLNYPVTDGNAFWTEPAGQATVEVSGNSVVMDQTTELDIATLDEHSLVASEPQGALYLSLHEMPNGDNYTVQTPRGAVQIAAVGRYEVVAGDTNRPTTVAVVEGSARVTGADVALQVAAGQMAVISGTSSFQGSVGPLQQDAFLGRMLAQERPAPRSAVPVPGVVAQMTGCQDLDRYGSWAEAPQYGTVWYPKVESDWVPYRHGRWSYVAPWGWTWVDEAPWGFAPFHYGRWAQIDGRWGWLPADGGAPAGYGPPVYAPALVSFFDVGAAAAAGAAAGALLAGSVGWVPLGPNEPYYPPYSHALGYVRQLNGASVRNVDTVITENSIRNVTNVTNNRIVVQNFVNRGGATVVPAADMARSAAIAGVARPLAPQQFGQARPQFAAPVRPTAATVGLTPAVARQFNIAPVVRPGAAGPAINPQALRAGPREGGFVPPLRAAAEGQPQPGVPARREAAPPGAGPRPGEVRPDEVARPGGPPPAETARPGVLPALRPATPGEAGRPAGAAGPGERPREVEPGRPAPEAGRPSGAPGPGRPVEPPRGAEPPRAAEPARPAEAPRAEPPHAEPVRPEPPRAEPPRAEPPRPEAPRAEPPRAEPPRALPPRAEPPRAAPARPEAPRPEAPRPEAPRPEAARPAAPPPRPAPAAHPAPPARPEPAGRPAREEEHH
jgi:hypothetical protein